MSLHHSCGRDWEQLGQRLSMDKADIKEFLDYAACFLSNVGNYYVSRSNANGVLV